MEDQDLSDFQKALDFSLERYKGKKLQILAHGAFGGRMDHTLQAIFTLKRFYQKSSIENQLVLLDKFFKEIDLRKLLLESRILGVDDNNH